MAPSRLRVVHVTWRLSRAGGIPVVIRGLCDGLDPERFETHVISARPRLDEDGLDELRTARLHHLDIVGPVGPLTRPVLAARTTAVVRRLRPDVVHGHSGTALYVAGAAALARTAARVLDVHDAPGRARHSRSTERLEGLSCRRFGFVPVVHSTSVRDDVVDRWRVPDDRVALVSLGIDTERFRPAERQEHRPPVLTVLYVTRLVPSKDVDGLLDVAHVLATHGDLPPWRIEVVGTGPEESRLRQRVEHEGLRGRVELIGRREGSALVDTYHRADVFVSTSAYEGFGLGVLEAMASGLPVVAAAVGGVTDLVADGDTGALRPHGDVEGLARVIAALLRDGQRRLAWGEAARARAVECFDIRRTVQGYAALYERLVET